MTTSLKNNNYRIIIKCTKMLMFSDSLSVNQLFRKCVFERTDDGDNMPPTQHTGDWRIQTNS